MVDTTVLETVPFGVVGSSPTLGTKNRIMTIDEMVSRIEKMGIEVTVDYKPSDEKIAYIKERLKAKLKTNEKRIQKMSGIGL